MSGTPNMQDIAELRKALAEVAKEDEAIRHAESNLQHAELCRDQAMQRRATAQAAVKKLMEAMDCAQPGNAGYANRLLALLAGLSTHAEHYGRTHQ